MSSAAPVPLSYCSGRFTPDFTVAFRPRGAFPGSESHMEATPEFHTWSFALHFFLFSCQGSALGGVPSLWPYNNMVLLEIHGKKVARIFIHNNKKRYRGVLRQRWDNR